MGIRRSSFRLRSFRFKGWYNDKRQLQSLYHLLKIESADIVRRIGLFLPNDDHVDPVAGDIRVDAVRKESYFSLKAIACPGNLRVLSYQFLEFLPGGRLNFTFERGHIGGGFIADQAVRVEDAEMQPAGTRNPRGHIQYPA